MGLVEFELSQMAALVLQEHCKLTPMLSGQIKRAPIKADIFRLRCELSELMNLPHLFEQAVLDKGTVNNVGEELCLEELQKLAQTFSN